MRFVVRLLLFRGRLISPEPYPNSLCLSSPNLIEPSLKRIRGFKVDKDRPFREDLYILRMWQEKEGENWRASIKNMRTKEVKYFSSLEGFVRYAKEIQTIKNQSKVRRAS